MSLYQHTCIIEVSFQSVQAGQHSTLHNKQINRPKTKNLQFESRLVYRREVDKLASDSLISPFCQGVMYVSVSISFLRIPRLQHNMKKYEKFFWHSQ